MTKIKIKNIRFIAIIAAVLLLTFQFGFQLYLAKTDSQTTDEAVHLSAGYTYLARNDFRYNPEHPPLIKELAALPLLILKPHIPDDSLQWSKAGNFYYDSWKENREFGDELLYQSGNNVDQILFWCRVPIIILTLLLGLTIFLIAIRLWGWLGGLFPLVMYVFDPTVTAHGHLITTDIGISLGILLSVWAFWCFLNRPNYKNIIWLGLAIGIAFLSKFTAIILVPIILVLFILYILKQKFCILDIVKLLVKIIIAIIISWFVIWAGYRFNTNLLPISLQISRAIAIANSSIRPLIIPRDFYKGLFMVVGHAGGGHSSFLLGQISNSGWWYYFPVLILFKTVPIELLIIFISIIVLYSLRSHNSLAKFLLVAAIVYLAVAMLTKADLGIRHILPIYPLLFIITGVLTKLKQNKIQEIMIIGLLILQIISWVRIQPYDLSYYNIFARGSYSGWKIAGDSNLDWGGDIKRIKKYIIDNQINSPFVDYSWDGESALDYYGIKRQPIAQFSPSSKDFIILSADIMHDPKYIWLKNRVPFARPTPGTFVYRLD